jgi:hypothetical protein
MVGLRLELEAQQWSSEPWNNTQNPMLVSLYVDARVVSLEMIHNAVVPLFSTFP